MKKLIAITSLSCLGILGLASCTTVENPAPTTTSTTTTRESATTVAPSTATQTTTTRSSGNY
jgi:hypothetical protein